MCFGYIWRCSFGAVYHRFPCIPYFWRYFIKISSFPVINFCYYYVEFFLSKPSLMSSWLLIIFVIGLSVTLEDFPSRLLKCSFYIYIRSSWLTAFSLALEAPCLLFISLNVCYAIQDCLSSTKFLISLTWPWMYSICSFWYAKISSLCVFLSFWALSSFYYIGILFSHCLIFS